MLHTRAKKNTGKFLCEICGTHFSSSGNLTRHKATPTHLTNVENLKGKNGTTKEIDRHENSPTKLKSRSKESIISMKRPAVTRSKKYKSESKESVSSSHSKKSSVSSSGAKKKSTTPHVKKSALLLQSAKILQLRKQLGKKKNSKNNAKKSPNVKLKSPVIKKEGNKMKNPMSSNSGVCKFCERLFSHRKNLRRHLKDVHKVDPNTHIFNEKDEKDELSQVPSVCSESNENFSTDISLSEDSVLHEEHLISSDNENYILKDQLLSPKAKLEVFDRYPELMKTLPNSHDYKILQFNPVDSNNDNSWFRVKLEFPCKSISDVEKWIKEYQSINNIILQMFNSKCVSEEGVYYKVNFRCCSEATCSKNFEPCSARIFISILSPFLSTQSTTPSAVIKIKHTHNHPVNNNSNVIIPLEDIKEKFSKLFEANYSVPEALARHKKDLEDQYGDDFNQIVQDNRIMPHIGWCYYLYYSMHYSDQTNNKSHSVKEPSNTFEPEPLEETIRKFREVTEDIISKSYIDPAIIQPVLQGCISSYRSNVNSLSAALKHLNRVYN